MQGRAARVQQLCRLCCSLRGGGCGWGQVAAGRSAVCTYHTTQTQSQQRSSSSECGDAGEWRLMSTAHPLAAIEIASCGDCWCGVQAQGAEALHSLQRKSCVLMHPTFTVLWVSPTAGAKWTTAAAESPTADALHVPRKPAPLVAPATQLYNVHTQAAAAGLAQPCRPPAAVAALLPQPAAEVAAVAAAAAALQCCHPRVPGCV